MKEIKEINIENYLKNPHWDLGNEILYNMCKEHFEHTEDSVVIAKTWFIGRLYAVALERRKMTEVEKNDSFYENTVVKAFKQSQIDDRLRELMQISNLTLEDIPRLLQTHKYLEDCLREITQQNKRSFCSKYLHFHLPNLFFIYDSRAVSSIRNIKISKIKIPNEVQEMIKSEKIDAEYAKFFYKCFTMKNEIEECNNIDSISPRQIDNCLLDLS